MPNDKRKRTLKNTTSGKIVSKNGFPKIMATRTAQLLDMQLSEVDVEYGVASRIALVRAGIRRSALDAMINVTGFSIPEFARLIHLSDRTLRRYTPHQHLPPEQSERMVALASLYSRGEEVFGSMERFKIWMGTSQIAFGDEQPKNFLDTIIGIGMITDELGRIEQGVFA